MSAMFDFDVLDRRLSEYVRGPLSGSEAAERLVGEVLRRGEVPRGEAARISGRAERTARDALRKLTDAGLLVSETPKGPVSMRFSAAAADALFPRLFPAQG
jgi:Fic family protein